MKEFFYGSPLEKFQRRCMVMTSGMFRGRTTRKPIMPPSVRYQMLLGFWGSCRFQAGELARRAALRSPSGSSSHDPPRTAWGALGVMTRGSFTGWPLRLA